MSVHALAQENSTPLRFYVEWRTEPVIVQEGQNVTVGITVKDSKGEVVPTLQLSHEKPLHLIVVSADLRTFAHLHPEPTGDGSYSTSHIFSSSGEHLLFADFVSPSGGPQVERFNVVVKGDSPQEVGLAEDPPGMVSREMDGLHITMNLEGPLRPDHDATMRFSVTDPITNDPVTDLQPYLGELAHFVIISEDGADFVHAHPIGKSEAAHSHHGNDGHPNTAREKNGQSGEVSAVARFPRSGLYKLWAQFQRSQKVITVPFVVRVEAGPHQHH